MPSMRQIESDVNEFCRVLEHSAQTEIEMADARREIDVVARCFHWIEINERMRKEAKKQQENKI